MSKKIYELIRVPFDGKIPEREWIKNPNAKMTVKGKEWTQEGLILAALVKRLGGKVEIKRSEIALVDVLMFISNDDGDVILEAE